MTDRHRATPRASAAPDRQSTWRTGKAAALLAGLALLGGALTIGPPWGSDQARADVEPTAEGPVPIAPPATVEADTETPPASSDATTTTRPPVDTHSARLDDLGSVRAADPTSVAIGDLGVEAQVAPAGVTDDGSGELDVPSQADGAVWYRFGPSPGSPGSAVVAGHVDFDGVEGVFFRLSELRPGSLVSIGYDDGSRRSFRVTDRRQVAKVALATDDIFSREGPPRLTLITCGGDFDPSTRSYRDNVVVTAVPVEA